MDYPDAIDRLLTLVDHERTAPAGPRQKVIPDLRRMECFLERLGNPQDGIPTVHITGTKGKGSTAAFCDAALHAAGFSTGFYSSPHLHSFRERIRRDSQPIGEEEFAGLVDQLWSHQQWVRDETDLGAVTLFEFMTGMAFQSFAQQNAGFQTVEVGLGGRLDATNVVRPEVCVITSISLDHTVILGDTIAQIAEDKAGIIKPGASVAIAPQRPEALSVILSACQDQGAVAIQVGQEVTWQAGDSSLEGQCLSVNGRLGQYQLRIPLLGEYQLENAATAVAALEALQERGHAVSAQAIERGFREVSWPCRLEVLSRDPLVVADGAHNAYSMGALMDTLPRYLDYRRLILLTGFSRDKSVDEMIERLVRAGPVSVFATRSRHPRSMPPAQITAMFREHGSPVEEVANPAQALEQALQQARSGDLILATGSLFVAAEVREAVLGIQPELYPDLLPSDLRTG